MQKTLSFAYSDGANMPKLVNLLENTKYLSEAKSLFVRAFPKDERPPFLMLRHEAKKGQVDLLILLDEGVFMGLAFLVPSSTFNYLYFLAVSENRRGKGYGHFILDELAKIYEGKPIMILAETLKEESRNRKQREERMSFYHHAGFMNLDYGSEEFGVKYDALSRGGYVSFDDYYFAMERLWGAGLAHKGIKKL